MTPARYLMLVLATLMGLSALAGLNAWSEFNRFTKSGYASCAYIERKTALASGFPSPKLVVVSGSNAALGINVRSLSGDLAIRGFNFALVATFSPGFQLFEARKVLKPGDAVLMPFEYLAYDYGSPTNGLVDAVYSCGLDYWKSLDWPERLFFVFALRPQRYFSTLSFDKQFVAEEETALERQIDSFGDSPLEAGAAAADEALAVGTHQPLVVRFRADSSGVAGIRGFIAWAKANHVAVFATWPNTLYFPQYATNPVFSEIANFYRGMGIEVIGTPQDGMLPENYLADTIYHLNPAGIALRTSKLTELLMADDAFAAWRRAGAETTPSPQPSPQ